MNNESTSNEDITNFQKIRKFREKVGEFGGLSKDFNAPEGLESQINDIIANFVKNCAPIDNIPQIQNAPITDFQTMVHLFSKCFV